MRLLQVRIEIAIFFFFLRLIYSQLQKRIHQKLSLIRKSSVNDTWPHPRSLLSARVQAVAMCEPAAAASGTHTRSRQQGPGGSPSRPWKSVNVDTCLPESQANSSSGGVARRADNDAGLRIRKSVVQQIHRAEQRTGGGEVTPYHRQTHHSGHQTFLISVPRL